MTPGQRVEALLARATPGLVTRFYQCDFCRGMSPTCDLGQFIRAEWDQSSLTKRLRLVVVFLPLLWLPIGLEVIRACRRPCFDCASAKWAERMAAQIHAHYPEWYQWQQFDSLVTFLCDAFGDDRDLLLEIGQACRDRVDMNDAMEGMDCEGDLP